MASSSSSSSSSSSLLVVLLSTFAFVLLMSVVTTRCEAAAGAADDAVAPGPTSGPLNLTGVLEKGGQYTTLLRLMKETQVGEQIQSQLNNSFDGLTIFAPTDNAFNNLKAGTLNSLTPSEQVSLILYHVLPRYYSLSTFETTSNPVRTQASGSNGVYSVNITSTSSQVNVSTGVDVTQISNKLYSEFPLAVYSVDSVLLPYDIFGAKPPAAAPAPSAPSKEPKGKRPAAKVNPTAKAKAPAAATTTSDDDDSSTTSPSPRGATCCWALLLAILVSVASLILS